MTTRFKKGSICDRWRAEADYYSRLHRITQEVMAKHGHIEDVEECNRCAQLEKTTNEDKYLDKRIEILVKYREMYHDEIYSLLQNYNS